MSNSDATTEILQPPVGEMAGGGTVSVNGDTKTKNKPRSTVNNYKFTEETEFFAEGASFLAALGIGLIPLSVLSEIAVVESERWNFYLDDDSEQALDFSVDGAIVEADTYPIAITATSGGDGANSAAIAGVLVFGADGSIYAFNLDSDGAVVGGAWVNNDQSPVMRGVVTAEQLERWLAHWGDFSVPGLTPSPSTESSENMLGAIVRNYIVGSDADDELIGDDNPNILDGGGGNDRLKGGGGGDTFIYRFDSRGERLSENWRGVDGRDEIVDFSLAEGDKLVFVDVSAAGERIDTVEEFRQAFNPDLAAGRESLLVIDTSDPGGNVLEIAFGEGEGGVRISIAEPISPDLIASGESYFDGISEFIEVLNSDDALF